jgi:transposase-like protein
VRRRIAASLAEGGAVRAMARRHNVSPASITNIRRSMRNDPEMLAA